MNESHSPYVNAEFPDVPKHVGIIMDGNGRWAKDRHLPRLAGHRAGTENILTVIDLMIGFGVEFLTLYAFSTENWQRPPEEVKGLMGILRHVIMRESKALHNKGVKVRHIGRKDRLPGNLQQSISDIERLTENNNVIRLNVAFDYGGRAEILKVIKDIIKEGVSSDDIDHNIINKYLYTSDIPDPDLIVRTAGELRLSNFLIWQSAYSEYYFTKALWPDFGAEDLREALESYGRRSRRFGKLKP